MRNPFHTALTAATAASIALVPVAALAQTGIDGRVDKLEREMRAVQRTVFPGGAGKFVQPEITAPTTPQTVPGVPASSALSDLETRLSAIERQQTTLTGQIEQNQNRIRQLEEAFAAYKRATDARLGAGTASTNGGGERVETVGTATEPTPRTDGSRTSAGAPVPRTEAPRAGQTTAVERPPSSGDPAEDSYLYGYRLWEAKQYGAAQAALKDTVAKYPRHRRASYAQNLLGRAYLDEGRPSLASIAFYDSFKKYPDGERAPDSLYFLGQSLMKLNKPADACKVYAELDTTYGSKIGPDLKAKADKGRADAKCK